MTTPIAPTAAADPVTTTPIDKEIHDRLAEEIEQTLPEGPSPRSDRTRVANRFLFAFGALALGGVIVLLFVRGGPAAGAVGLFILFLYAFMGSTPWMAGTLRARDRREVELVVDNEMQTRHPVDPPRPA